MNMFCIKLKSEIIEYIGHEQIITFNFSINNFRKISINNNIQMDKELDLYIDLNQISLFDKKVKIEFNMKAIYPDLENKNVFITGGGSGIGGSIVEHFCEQGSNVHFIDIDTEESNKLISLKNREL